MILNFLSSKKNIALIVVTLLILFVIIFIMFTPLSCKIISNNENRNAKNNTTTKGDNINRDDVLIVGCDANYPPFEFSENGDTVGFDIDIIKEITGRMGKEIEIAPILWDCKFKEIEEEKLDMEISAVPITEEYKNIVDFSNPYFTLEYLLISLSEAEIKIKEDLGGKAVGILEIEKGDLSEDCLLNYEICTYDDIIEMFNDLQNKKIEAVLISLPQGVNKLKDNEEMYIVLEKIKSNKEFGIVFKKGSMLKEKVDRVLEDIKEDGTYDEIYNKWFEL